MFRTNFVRSKLVRIQKKVYYITIGLSSVITTSVNLTEYEKRRRKESTIQQLNKRICKLSQKSKIRIQFRSIECSVHCMNEIYYRYLF